MHPCILASSLRLYDLAKKDQTLLRQSRSSAVYSFVFEEHRLVWLTCLCDKWNIDIIIVLVICVCYVLLSRSRKGQKYTLLLDGCLVKGYPWRIWVIIDTPHPVCRKGNLVGAWRVVCYKWSSNKSYKDRGRWCSWYGFYSLQKVTTLSVSESAVPDNSKVANQVICPHSM